MRYSNAPEQEGVNAQEGRGEGREFLLLGVTFFVILAALSFFFLRVGALLGPLVPFSWEQRFAPTSLLSQLEPGPAQTQQRLQGLANQIAAAIDMPGGIDVTVHYSSGATKNAFATFGGHVVLFKGLLDDLGSEDAVAALLAHELGHVKHRHVIKGATGGVLLSLMWAGIGIGSDMAAQIGGVTQMTQLPMLSRTRAMERKADEEALAALVALYGHAAGYFELFDALGRLSANDVEAVPNLLRSHPKVAERIAAAKTALPASLRRGPLTPWLGAKAAL